MFDPKTQAIIDSIRSTVTISSVLPGVKDSGSSDCPFCGGRGKFFVKKGWARCFRPSCELSQKSFDVIGLYRYKHKLIGNKGSFFKALEEMSKSYSLPCSSFLNDENEKLLSVIQKASSFYNYEINSRFGKEALLYLKNRSIDLSLVDMLQIGYARNDFILRSYGLNEKDLELAGLFNGVSESFSNRIVFPIRSISGDIVAFTGRYIGSIPEVNKEPLFPRWKHSSVQERPGVSSYLGLEENIPNYSEEYVVLTEGYVDCLSLYQLGIQSLCMFGLHGLHKHIHKLKKFKKIYCSFDIDTFDKTHQLFPNEYKSWRVVIPQLIDAQVMLPSSVIYVHFIPGEVSSNKGSFICKDINDWVIASNPSKMEVMDRLSKSKSLLNYLIETQGPNLQYHESLLRLCLSTNSDYSCLEKFIPDGMSSLDYAVALMTR